MFKSGITVKELIDQVQNEVDIAIDVGNDAVLQSYNGLIAGLYRDIVKKECGQSYKINKKGSAENRYADWTTGEFSAECVYRVFTEDYFEAEKVNPTYALITDRVCWYPSGEKEITLRNFPGESCIVVYYAMPEVADSVDSPSIVPVPIDFIDMVKAKIRGDMYNISNDDDLAAKWYNIYNSRIEDFKIFISENRTEVNG